MPLVPKLSPVPPGGYHFIDKSGGVETLINGSDYANVAQRVLEYRLRNRLPPGNCLQEVYDFVCNTWPQQCADTSPQPVIHSVNFRPSLALRTSAWMGRFATLIAPGDGGVSQGQAQARASVCQGCPRNLNYRGGCPSCVQSIDQQSFVYRKNRDVPAGDALGACDVLDEHLRTSVWSAKLGSITEAQRILVPDNCWRKNT